MFKEAHRVETELHLEAGVADSLAQVAEGSLTPLYLALPNGILGRRREPCALPVPISPNARRTARCCRKP